MGRSRKAKSGASLKIYYSFFLSVAGLVAFDQFTKYLVVQDLPLNTARVIVPGLLNLVHVHNPGGAFSLFARAGSEWRLRIFIFLTLLVLGIIAYAYGRLAKSERWNRAAYTFICGGAAGNLVDRLRMGEVIDFIDFYAGTWHWPAFNVADSAISAGAVMLLISLIRGR